MVNTRCTYLFVQFFCTLLCCPFLVLPRDERTGSAAVLPFQFCGTWWRAYMVQVCTTRGAVLPPSFLLPPFCCMGVPCLPPALPWLLRWDSSYNVPAPLCTLPLPAAHCRVLVVIRSGHVHLFFCTSFLSWFLYIFSCLPLFYFFLRAFFVLPLFLLYICHRTFCMHRSLSVGDGYTSVHFPNICTFLYIFRYR